MRSRQESFMNRLIPGVLLTVLLISGCSNQVLVPYGQVENNNWVTVTMSSGERIEGSVLTAEPHLLKIRDRNGRTRRVEISRMIEIKRIPPYYDDFGNAISEEEIARIKTGKNAAIYGFGGGLLSFGASFFVGNMIAKNASDGGTVLAATTGVGGLLGTTLFVRAGKQQDRKEAAMKIRASRKSNRVVRPSQKKPSLDEIKKEVDDEKKKQEELRRQREKLLRELEKSRKNND